MDDERNSICSNIFSAIQDNMKNLYAPEIFSKSSFEELGAFYYGALIDTVEGATTELINAVVATLKKNSKFEEQEEYYKNLCYILGFKLLPKEAYDWVQNKYVMQEEIRKLDEKIPAHPINPDNTRSFTLYSLKSMLEGSLETHYSWAHELCDRRKKSAHSLDDTIRGLSFTSFSSDSEFLQAILPDMVFQYVKCKLVDSPYTIADIMTGNFPDEWKEQICLSFKQDSGVRFNRLLKKSNNLLTDKRQYWLDCDILFELLGNDGVFLRRCHQHSVSYQSSYIGLALLTVYALVGSQHFQNHLFYSDGEVMRYFTTKC